MAYTLPGIFAAPVQFADVKIGEKFYSNGAFCTKMTTKTADLHHLGYSKRFYFRRTDTVYVETAF